jgi:hypothetical protein
MDAFWCITFGFLILRAYIKSEAKKASKNIEPEQPKTYTLDEQNADEIQKERDRAELRKQGFTEELITVIIPTINNGK